MPCPSDNGQRISPEAEPGGEMRRAGSPAIRQATRPTSADADRRHGQPLLGLQFVQANSLDRRCETTNAGAAGTEGVGSEPGVLPG